MWAVKGKTPCFENFALGRDEWSTSCADSFNHHHHPNPIPSPHEKDPHDFYGGVCYVNILEETYFG
jgi:hypothetical protein